MLQSSRGWAILLLAIGLVALLADANSSLDEQSKELAAISTKYMTVPSSLVRLLFYNLREHPISYKRSSSALDPLAGLTLGKRSISPVEFLNMEPTYSRFHPGANMYLMRWAPVGGYDALDGGSDA